MKLTCHDIDFLNFHLTNGAGQPCRPSSLRCMFQQQKADSSRLLGAIFQWDHPGCACPAWLEGIVLCTTKGTMTTHLHHQKAMTMKQPSTYRDWQAAVEESNVIYNVGRLGWAAVLIVGLVHQVAHPARPALSRHGISPRFCTMNHYYSWMPLDFMTSYVGMGPNCKTCHGVRQRQLITSQGCT